MNLRAKTLPARAVLLSCALGAVVVTTTGCPNTDASLTSFSERYDEIFANKPKTACADAYVPLTVGAGDGQYLLALTATTLKADIPILFLAEVTTPATSGDVGIAMTVSPLDKIDRRTVVGDAQTFEAVAIDSAGAFTIELKGLKVPTAANPIIAVDVEATVQLMGNVCGDASFVCGTVTGETVSPKANLEGSTFTLMRIEDMAKYPDPVLNCEETPAGPAPTM